MREVDRILNSLSTAELAMLWAQDRAWPFTPRQRAQIGLAEPSSFGAGRIERQVIAAAMDDSYAKWLPVYVAAGWVRVRTKKVGQRKGLRVRAA